MSGTSTGVFSPDNAMTRAMLVTVLMEGVKELTVTIPESLDYTGAFDDIFDEYTERCDLSQVRTTNMGSLYRLKYMIRMKDESREKQMLDELRCRNGNLDIICGHPVTAKKESL